jgi:hypothetical protein
MPKIFDDLGNVISSTANTAVDSVKIQLTATASSKDKTQAYTSRKNAGEYSAGKYNIKNYSYPEDLMADDARYGGNYAIFYINVAEDSKLITRDNRATVQDYSARIRGDLVGMGLTKTELVGANVIGGIVDGAILGGLFSGNVTGAAEGAVKGAVVGVVTGGVIALAAPETLRAQKRLETAIALHIPNNLSITYGMQWSEDDTAGFAMSAALARAGINTSGEILKAISSNGKDSDVSGELSKAGNAIGGIATNLALSKGPMGAGNSVATGMAANPKKEQVFKGVNFRTFSFEYKFFPRNEAEAQKVLNIIKEFKLHMHPEFKDTNNFVYIYPSEFDISYYTGGKENKNIHRHTSCVLTDLSVNYAPNGMFNTFDNGMPTQIDMTLSFRELALLTKDRILEGL